MSTHSPAGETPQVRCTDEYNQGPDGDLPASVPIKVAAPPPSGAFWSWLHNTLISAYCILLPPAEHRDQPKTSSGDKSLTGHWVGSYFHRPVWLLWPLAGWWTQHLSNPLQAHSCAFCSAFILFLTLAWSGGTKLTDARDLGAAWSLFLPGKHRDVKWGQQRDFYCTENLLSIHLLLTSVGYVKKASYTTGCE